MAHSIFVANLSLGTTALALGDAFEAYGEVERVKLATEPGTGRSRGFAFVAMHDEGASRRAICAMDGILFEGRVLRVSVAAFQEPRAGHGTPDGADR